MSSLHSLFFLFPFEVVVVTNVAYNGSETVVYILNEDGFFKFVIRTLPEPFGLIPKSVVHF